VAGLPIFFRSLSPMAVIDFVTVAVLLAGVGLLLLLSHGRRFRFFRRLFGRSRLRLTLEGKLFLVLSGIICAAAINTSINLMYFVAGLTLSALLVSLAFSRNIRKIDVRRSAPHSVHAGEQVSVRLCLTSRRRRLTLFTLVVQDHANGPADAKLPPVGVLQLRAGATQTVSYRCTFPRRGVYRFTAVTLRSRFPFGLFEIQYEHPLEQEIIVCPAIGTIANLPAGHANRMGRMMLNGAAAGQDEFSHLRDYRPDDNPRRIHWRTSARLGKLHVMEFRGLPARSASIQFDPTIDSTSKATAEHFEKAARFAATIADHLASRDYSLTFRLDGTGPITGPGKRLLPEIFESLARVEPVPGAAPPEHEGNGNDGLNISVGVRGRCSFGGNRMLAAASDPDLARWFQDQEARR